MSQISLKSLSGITSITTPSGVDNQFTVHTNDTTERIKVTSSGLNVTGVLTATSFVGDGSGLTGAGPTLTNGADNRVITASSASAIQGEANMTFDGSTLTLTPGSSAGDVTSLVLGRTSSAPAVQTTAVVTGGIPVSGVPGIFFGSTNTNLPAIGFQTPNSSNGHIVFNPKGSEKVRISHNGNLKLPDDSKLGLGDVQTNDGDLQLYHDGNNSYIDENGAGNLRIRTVNGNGIELIYSTGTLSLKTHYNGGVDLYHSGNQRLTTTSTGVTMNGTGAIILPIGTTGERPSGSNGMIRFNTSLSQTEEYRDGDWFGLSNKSTVSGGTVTTSGGYTIHTFTSSGTLTVSGSAKSGVDYLIVAGGGGGGNSRAGGGGGGGMTVTTGATIQSGTYTITVGAGGAGGTTGGGAGNTGVPGTTGSNTSFGSLASVTGGGGGGGGGSTSDRLGRNGGSGGGGSDGQAGGSGTSGQGNNGGGSTGITGGGGGGGAGGAGSQAPGSEDVGGNGGAASANSYSGSSVNYSGGGGGGSRDNAAPGTGGSGAGSGGKTTGANSTAGTPNRGGGGGGGGRHNGYSNEHFYGSNGGSGIVIIRYLT